MSLSDKIGHTFPEVENVLKVEDVKEAVQELKTKIAIYTQPEREDLDIAFNDALARLLKDIDEIFGDKLTGVKE